MARKNPAGLFSTDASKMGLWTRTDASGVGEENAAWIYFDFIAKNEEQAFGVDVQADLPNDHDQTIRLSFKYAQNFSLTDGSDLAFGGSIGAGIMSRDFSRLVVLDSTLNEIESRFWPDLAAGFIWEKGNWLIRGLCGSNNIFECRVCTGYRRSIHSSIVLRNRIQVALE